VLSIVALLSQTCQGANFKDLSKKKKVKKDALENPQFPGKEKIMEVI